MKSFAALLVVIVMQFCIYLLCFRPFILHWGVTGAEFTMPMKGDKYAETISCTRAINVDAPAPVVWKYLACLGADRGGFYSYTFLERLYGAEFAGKPGTGHSDIPVGRLIPFTVSPETSLKNDGFTVIESEQNRYFVLKGWGEFLLQEKQGGKTRFYLRTHWKKSERLIDRLWTWVFDAGHYIMERRMMLGIGHYAETGRPYNLPAGDIIWFIGVVLSGLTGLLLPFISQGHYKLLLPSVLLIIWQFFVLVLNPKPLPAVILLLLAVYFGYLSRKEPGTENRGTSDEGQGTSEISKVIVVTDSLQAVENP